MARASRRVPTWWSRRRPRAGRRERCGSPLAGAIEERWRSADSATTRSTTADRRWLAVVGQVDVELPRYLPVSWCDGLRTLVPHLESVSAQAAPMARRRPRSTSSALLAQVLLLLTVDVRARVGAVARDRANVLRVIDDDGIRVRDLPALAGVSKEAIRASFTLPRAARTALSSSPTRTRAATKIARLTQKGRAARESVGPLLAVVEARWQARFGADEIEQLHAALGALLERSASARKDWSRRRTVGGRSKPYAGKRPRWSRIPAPRLPHYPMIVAPRRLARRQLERR